MKSKNSLQVNSFGFTLLEILIVLSILGVLLSVILPSLNRFRQNSILNTETQEMITLINRARLLSVSSKNDQQFGVHFEATKVVLFVGAVYSAVAVTNEAHVFNSMLTLSSIAINGGGAEMLFEKVTGSTSQNATTTLLVIGTTASSTMVIRPTGVATIN
ncbi:MAG: type II secretion system protein [Candidatus Yonathbacteria bacterium]|nr:type II secretion system protein [Candidatus Yonathbacteria bacterium]